MWQAVIVGLIVLAAATYAAWALLPAALRLRLARHLAATARRVRRTRVAGEVRGRDRGQRAAARSAAAATAARCRRPRPRPRVATKPEHRAPRPSHCGRPSQVSVNTCSPDPPSWGQIRTRAAVAARCVPRGNCHPARRSNKGASTMFRARDLRLIVPVLGLSALLLTLALPASAQEAAAGHVRGTGRRAAEDPELEVPRLPRRRRDEGRRRQFAGGPRSRIQGRRAQARRVRRVPRQPRSRPSIRATSSARCPSTSAWTATRTRSRRSRPACTPRSRAASRRPARAATAASTRPCAATTPPRRCRT